MITKPSFNVRVLIQFRFFFGLKIQLIGHFSTSCLVSSVCYKLEQNKNIMKALLPFHIHKAGAGFPSPATDYVEDNIDLNSYLIKNMPSTFLIRVQGKSMTEVGVYDGDLLIVDRSLNPKNFSTVIANVNEELVVKTFIKKENQSFLTSGSKEIKDKINLTENPEIFVWGVVIYVIHAL